MGLQEYTGDFFGFGDVLLFDGQGGGDGLRTL
jgi:hypothetical protein